MRHFIALMLAFALSGCTDRAVWYETYVQINKAAEPGKAFVLVLAKNPHAPKDRPDVASAHFVLGQGESKTATYRNRHYPSRAYEFSVLLNKDILLVDLRVNDGAQQLFESRQQFASWGGL